MLISKKPKPLRSASNILIFQVPFCPIPIGLRPIERPCGARPRHFDCVAIMCCFTGGVAGAGV
jgi:hypothetical protein